MFTKYLDETNQYLKNTALSGHWRANCVYPESLTKATVCTPPEWSVMDVSKSWWNWDVSLEKSEYKSHNRVFPVMALCQKKIRIQNLCSIWIFQINLAETFILWIKCSVDCPAIHNFLILWLIIKLYNEWVIKYFY